jgi:hypothetical protein
MDVNIDKSRCDEPSPGVNDDGVSRGPDIPSAPDLLDAPAVDDDDAVVDEPIGQDDRAVDKANGRPPG